MNDISKTEAHEIAAPVHVGLTDIAGFELAQRSAKLLAASTIVPAEYQGNLPNCVVALNMAARLEADPLMVMQNLYMVHGRPGWSATFLIATFNSCGRFGPIRYTFFGKQPDDDWGCHAWAVEKATGEQIVGADITIGLAKREGWYGRQGSKWKTMPQQMLMYRSAAWLVRAYAPELSMGLHTVEEIGDVYDAERGAGGEYAVSEPKRQTVADLKRGSAQSSVDTDTGEVSEDQASIAVEELEKEVEAELEKPTDEKTGVPWFDEEEQRNVEREKEKSVDQTEPATEEWPMKDAEGRIVDSKGTVFDSAIHGMSSSGVPARTKNNVFRKRRGVQVEGLKKAVNLPEPAEPVPADESDQSEPPKIDTQVIRDMLRQASSNEEIDEITEVIAKIDHPAEQYVLNQFAAARREQINRE